MDQNSLNFPHSLGEAHLSDGLCALAQGDIESGLRYFDDAMQSDPHHAPLYYTQGLALFEFGEKHKQPKILMQAKKRLEMAAYLDPQHVETWRLWGDVLYRLAALHNDIRYLQSAKEKIAHALDLVQTSELYCRLGTICKQCAHASGEPSDWHEALGAFHQASLLHKQLPAPFWKEYATACAAFASRLQDVRLHLKAVHLMKQALILSPENPHYWQEFAGLLHTVYQQTHDEQHLTQANDSYKTAAELDSEDNRTWIEWAKLLLCAAHITYDVKAMHACIEKCQRAAGPHSVCIRAEALALLGSENDQLDPLLEAREKIEEVIDTYERMPAAWHAYATVLTALGHYFNDPEYYYEAIETFQEGLSLDRTLHTHWNGIGRLYTLLAEIEQNRAYSQRALRFLKRAVDLTFSSVYTIDYAIALFKLGEMTREQEWLEEASIQFQKGLLSQKNALYIHPEWLFHYGCCLDALGDFHEEDTYYVRALEIFSHVLMVDPDFHTAHHRLALTLSHLGELTDDVHHFHRAIEHLRLCAKHDPENDVILLDWAVILLNIACRSDTIEAESLYRDAEDRLWHVLRLGNPHAYYHLACLYSLLDQTAKSMLCLRKAHDFRTLPTLDELMQDEWLDAVRCTGDFIDFYDHLERRTHFQKED